MGQKQDARTLYTISCACGATASLDARGFGRPIVCKKCGGSFTVGWGKDPSTKKTTPIAVTLAKKRGPLQLACSCGYRRSVSGAEAATNPRCPGCGKSMMVTKPPPGKLRESDRVVKLASAAPARPPAAAAPRPSAPAAPVLVEISPNAHAFNCPCGERLLVRTHTLGNVTPCPICDRKLQVVVQGAARKGSSATLPAVAPPPPPGSRTPTPIPGARTPTPPPQFTKPELSCECGQSLELVKAFDANGTVCPACGRTITMEKIRRPESKHTVIRPRFAPKAGPAATPAPPPPPEHKIPVAPASEPGGMFEMPTAEFVEEDNPAVGSSSSSYQEVFCHCGEALTVGTDDVGKNMQCPTCLTLMAVDQLRDPKTGNGVLRVRAIGKMDQDTWSLSDFS